MANHVASGVTVAVKYVGDDLRRDDEYLARFRSDARRLAELESPNVAELYEYVESADGVATVREYVAGASVRELLAAGPLRPEAALSVLKGGLLGLAAIHDNGATHGGYKPENLLLDADGNTKLADSGATPDTGTAADDVVAAMATLRECLAGSVPKRLLGLVSTATGGETLLQDLDTAARKAYGDSWESRGRRRLADQTERVVRRRRPQR
jgi:serine/threonine-protein kinase